MARDCGPPRRAQGWLASRTRRSLVATPPPFCSNLPLTCHGSPMWPPRRRFVMSKTYYVYVLASRKNGTLYIGVTNDLIRRVWEHREGITEGFTKEYGVKML